MCVDFNSFINKLILSIFSFVCRSHYTMNEMEEPWLNLKLLDGTMLYAFIWLPVFDDKFASIIIIACVYIFIIYNCLNLMILFN